MGRLMREAFVMTDEQACYFSEVELAEMAQVLRMLALELGHAVDPGIDTLARHGLDAALVELAQRNGRASLSDAYYRHRALWRAGQAFLPPVD